ncbi:MAG TPA: nuclear transport factor 2 family protein [Caulobacteraceae bacterium]|nr:nuclear transport factor 2 family protein [Caulobacteraceae bacterium]
MTGMSDARYAAIRPYCELVLQGLGGLVDAADYFDAFAEDAEFEVRYDFAGWPRIVRGRDALVEQFSRYADNVTLHAADNLLAHVADGGQLVTLEYEVHGTIRATGARYDNRFCSIVALAGRKIARWRDYMDSLSAWKALTAPAGAAGGGQA